jgi:hypothetical protein
MTHNLTLEPGEITVILAENINDATRHACHTAKVLADKGIGVQLLNCGMMSRRFWKVAREEAASHVTDRHGSKLLRLETCIRGNLVADRRYYSDLRVAYGAKVLIVSGWEWSSKSWRLKEDLIFHLREIAEDEDVAIIVYSQARSNPEQGCFDRGGVGKLSAIAATIMRINDDPDEEPMSEIVYMASDELEKYIQKPRQIADKPRTFLDEFVERAQLTDREINELSGVRAGEEVLEYA